jgi:hypothetical protein
MHRAGVEPATFRLKAGSSAELSYRCADAPGGIRTPNKLFRRELLCSVELPVRQCLKHRFRLSSIVHLNQRIEKESNLQPPVS